MKLTYIFKLYCFKSCFLFLFRRKKGPYIFPRLFLNLLKGVEILKFDDSLDESQSLLLQKLENDPYLKSDFRDYFK